MNSERCRCSSPRIMPLYMLEGIFKNGSQAQRIAAQETLNLTESMRAARITQSAASARSALSGAGAGTHKNRKVDTVPHGTSLLESWFGARERVQQVTWLSTKHTTDSGPRPSFIATFTKAILLIMPERICLPRFTMATSTTMLSGTERRRFSVMATELSLIASPLLLI